MSSITVSRSIAAPVDLVFKTVADIEGFSEAVPDIVKVEFLTDLKTGVGARFKETRIMKGREATTELEVTEYVENERIRLVSDAGGTIWDSVFTVTPEGEGTLLELSMEARPYKFMARVMNLLIKGVLKKALAADMDSVKVYCEK